MAKPPPEQKILITGVSGFLGSHIANSFLKKRYKVLGIVRSQASAAKVLDCHQEHTHQLTFAILDNLADPDTLKKAIQDVDGVIHVASPFRFNVTDNEQELLLPAIQSTTSLLEAIVASGSPVRRVVLTSSHAAIVTPTRHYTDVDSLSESDWNATTYEEAKGGPPPLAYAASKAFAEHAAWDFIKERRPGFDLTTLNPPLIFGPVIHAVESVDKLNTSSASIYHLMDGSRKEIGPTHVPFMVDVRDIAEAHLRAYETTEAGGKRFVVYGHSFSYQDVCGVVRDAYPQLKTKVPNPEAEPFTGSLYGLSKERASEVLGMSYRPFKETIIDTAASLMKIASHSEAGKLL